jgi:hypothetical protein
MSESLSALEKDLDCLLQRGRLEATARWGAFGCFGASDLMITSTPEGRFVHWKGMKPSDLLEAEDRLVAHLEPLPFQEGRPLATVVEGSTELVDESSEELISRQVLMAEEGEDDGDLPIVRTKMTPITQLVKGGSMSACGPCIASLTLNSLP